MDAIAGMLMRPDLVGSAVVQNHLVELLAYMLSGAQKHRGTQRNLAFSFSSAGVCDGALMGIMGGSRVGLEVLGRQDDQTARA